MVVSGPPFTLYILGGKLVNLNMTVITFGEPLLSGCLLFYWLDIPYANIFLISLLWANITYQLAYLN